MRHVDASSMVHAWDTYPPDIFPKVWEWIEAQIAHNEMVISQPAKDEVEHVAPDCAAWLGKASIQICAVSNAALQRARLLKNNLGIQNDNYHPRGVDENDLLIICCAYCSSVELVSNEARQPSLPSDRRRYKIPAVCASYGPLCIDFLAYMRSAARTFG